MMWKLTVIALFLHTVSCELSYPLLSIDYDTTELSPECIQVLKSVKKPGADNSWLASMVDSTSKIPSGLAMGNRGDLGSFDECLAIKQTVSGIPIVGKYCANAVNTLLFQKYPTSLAMCIPDVCNIKHMFSKVPIVLINDAMCQTKNSDAEWDAGDWSMLSVLCVIVGIMLISTLYDIYKSKHDKKSWTPLIIAFSVYTNGKKLFATSDSPDMIHCLHGLRFISMMWIVAAHRFGSVVLLPIINWDDAYKFQENVASSYVQGAYVAVDTFFFMSAFLSSYMYFKKVEKRPLTFKQIPVYYFHRLFRITPALVAVYFMQLTLIRRIGSGPRWPAAFNYTRDTCTKWWWSLFLYVQNYVNPKEICIVPTWYLSADMQMFLVAPFLILPLGHLIRSNKKSVAYYLCSLVIMICILVPMIVDFIRPNTNEFATHTRLSIYVIGILMGMLIVDLKYKKIKIGQVVNWAIWCFALAGMLLIIVYTQDVRTFPTDLKTNLFHSFSRPLWSIGLCWIVYSCTIGSGGFVNWFLSWPVFQIMGKISYSMYLLHYSVIMISVASTRASINFSEYNIIYYFCGDFILTILISFVWVFMFEMPMVGIESVIFGQGKPKVADLKAKGDNI